MNKTGHEGVSPRRTLGTLDVFSIAPGAMISLGKIGPGIIPAYLLAPVFDKIIRNAHRFHLAGAVRKITAVVLCQKNR